MNEETGFTAAQMEAYEKACELLHEHFDASVIAIQACCEDDDKQEIKAVDFHGGLSTCIGLGEIAVLSMKNEAAYNLGRKEEEE